MDIDLSVNEKSPADLSVNEKSPAETMAGTRKQMSTPQKQVVISLFEDGVNKGNNKITELRTILQRESQNS